MLSDSRLPPLLKLGLCFLGYYVTESDSFRLFETFQKIEDCFGLSLHYNRFRLQLLSYAVDAYFCCLCFVQRWSKYFSTEDNGGSVTISACCHCLICIIWNECMKETHNRQVALCPTASVCFEINCVKILIKFYTVDAKGFWRWFTYRIIELLDFTRRPM